MVPSGAISTTETTKLHAFAASTARVISAFVNRVAAIYALPCGVDDRKSPRSSRRIMALRWKGDQGGRICLGPDHLIIFDVDLGCLDHRFSSGFRRWPPLPGARKEISFRVCP